VFTKATGAAQLAETQAMTAHRTTQFRIPEASESLLAAILIGVGFEIERSLTR